MTDAAWNKAIEGLDVSRVVTEDDEPADNIPSEKNQRLLVGALYGGWSGPPRHADDPDRDSPREFLAVANVGLFTRPSEPPVVPDVMVSADVQVDALTWAEGGPRAYLMWEMGKPPELAIELVSNREGAELSTKKAKYARTRVAYYAVFDPGGYLGAEVLQAFEMRGDIYRPIEPVDGILRFETLGLGLRLWDGVFEGAHGQWLRFVDADGELLHTGDERAEAEHARAEAEHSRAERLAAKLRALGIDPD